MSKIFLNSALKLVEMGFFVFPAYGVKDDKSCTCTKGAACTAPGKHPILSSWQTMASNSPETIEKWAKKYPEANVAVMTGKKSGITVLDCDGEEGLNSIQELEKEHGPLSEAITVETGSGGRHYYFAYTPEVNNAVRFLPGLDIRSEGGYVIAPDSGHVSGGKYAFINDSVSALSLFPPFILEQFNKFQHNKGNVTKKSILKEGERNSALFTTWLAQWHQGLTEKEILEGLEKDNQTRCKPPLPHEEIKKLAKSICSYEPNLQSHDEDGRRNILLGKTQLRDTADLAEKALNETNGKDKTLYRNQSTLIQTMNINGEICTKPVTGDVLMTELCKNINWFKPSGKDFKPADPSERLIKYLLNNMDLGSYPVLKGVSNWPVVDKTGKILSKSGYYPEIERYISLPKNYQLDVPEVPTPEDLRWALGLLKGDLLGDFPFADKASLAHSIAAMLQTFCAPLISPPYPLHFVQAPIAGAGKSLLVKLIVQIVMGKEPSVLTLGENDAETRKRLSSQLFSLSPYVFLDNLPYSVKSNALAAALTTGTWSDRLLATNINKKVDVESLWLATGNNVTFSNELARRIVLIDFIPVHESPSQRKDYKHPEIEKWTSSCREDLIKANLILIKHWFAQGCPQSSVAFGSYESYARIIGGILSSAGIDGFLENRTEEFLNQDDDSGYWNIVVAEWYHHFGESKVGAGKILGKLDREFVSEFFSGNDQYTSFGMKLSRVKNRIFKGLKIIPRGTGDRGQKLYSLQKVSGNTKTYEEIY